MRRFSSLTLLLIVGCSTEPKGDPSLVEPEQHAGGASAPDASVAPVVDATPSPYLFERLGDPPRTEARDRDGHWVATFTDGARTVQVRGPERTFEEETAPDPVIHDVWVRVLPEAFDGVVDEAWLAAQCDSTEPDVLAIAMQYVAGAPVVLDGALQIAGDAHYGPMVDGVRVEGSDFNDYLGLDWPYDADADAAEPSQLGSLDCSGYMRMVWGYRAGVPLVPGHDGAGDALPRRAVTMLQSGPGVVTIDDTGVRAPIDGVEIGDLVFFDADADDGTDVDHVGMFLGLDTDGRARFLSSRKSIDGPTFGDYNGASCLDGAGLYATSFRAARRI